MTFLAFAQENILLFAGAAVLLGLVLFTEFRNLQLRGANLSPTGLTQEVNRGATLIDLRNDDAYKTGHITGAKNIAPDEIEKFLSKTAKDSDIVLYCATGNTSAKTVIKLRKQGFTNVKHLVGGIIEWDKENLPLESTHKHKHK